MADPFYKAYITPLTHHILSQMKEDDFINTMTHELKTPISISILNQRGFGFMLALKSKIKS